MIQNTPYLDGNEHLCDVLSHYTINHNYNFEDLENKLKENKLIFSSKKEGFNIVDKYIKKSKIDNLTIRNSHFLFVYYKGKSIYVVTTIISGEELLKSINRDDGFSDYIDCLWFELGWDGGTIPNLVLPNEVAIHYQPTYNCITK